MTFTPSTAPTDVGASLSLLECHTTAHRLVKQFPVLKEAISVLEADTAPVLAGLDDLQSTAQHLQRSLKFLFLNSKPDSRKVESLLMGKPVYTSVLIELLDGIPYLFNPALFHDLDDASRRLQIRTFERCIAEDEKRKQYEATEEEVADATQAAD